MPDYAFLFENVHKGREHEVVHLCLFPKRKLASLLVFRMISSNERLNLNFSKRRLIVFCDSIAS